ncbi:hypothetical protein SERLADRAFT_363606 [Serpula lacrymans var. lacrymans S7.9]|uniref:AMP-dependent synthetase/ligase domain-containing protein n=1 Tax=Serpula lacrymans var. lacrymans (strain S7.9) TaxID=578457 RepID=F8P9D1_SERL9|nr:uncharacterized protein SERLADRAFT_363606 [Serpula lacrymans var. lacrymans S7.9]EGO20260.1 hypothetical protein SERLADRAFT_363606 [Serpula lacrymans var. lacrymans S7.9]
MLFPPLDGSLLLPELFAFNARHNTDRPFYIFSNADGLTTVTHLEFYRACHRVAHALRPNRTGPEGEVIAIIAQTDNILYAALIVGTMIAGAIVRIFHLFRFHLLKVTVAIPHVSTKLRSRSDEYAAEDWLSPNNFHAVFSACSLG